MDIPSTARTVPPAAIRRDGGGGLESVLSAVSWAAIFAGGVTAAAIGAVLVALGSGIGLASVSPWSNHNPSLTTFTVGAAIWVIVVHWIASATGGYMTGRLRTKWVDLHTDEVFFRDTAHGFLAWALAALMIFAAGGLVTAMGVGAIGAGATASRAAGGGDDMRTYTVDTLFRPTQPGAAAQPVDDVTRAEATRIMAVGLASSQAPADRDYLAQMVAARTGVPADEARKRVDDAIVKLRDAANQARKAGASLSIVTALAMVIGAFVACVAAALGGRLRDEY